MATILDYLSKEIKYGNAVNLILQQGNIKSFNIISDKILLVKCVDCYMLMDFKNNNLTNDWTYGFFSKYHYTAINDIIH